MPSIIFSSFPSRVFIVIFLLCKFSASLVAQRASQQYPFRRIDIGTGLSNDQVTTILKDSRGFMWFGTMQGLNRYDGLAFKVFKHDPQVANSIDDDYIIRIWEAPDHKLLVATRKHINIYDDSTEQFSQNTGAFLRRLSLPDTAVLNVVRTPSGDFYFLFAGKGLYRYDHITKRSKEIRLENSADITGFSKNGEGDIWIIYRNGIFARLDVKTNKIVYQSRTLSDYMHGQKLEYTIMADADNELWLYGVSSQTGLFYFRPSVDLLIPVNKDSQKFRLNTNLVKGILQDDQKQIWVCTDHGGINIINKRTSTIRYVMHNDDDNNSISQNSITTAYKDDQGVVWIGTFKKGVNCFHKSLIKFPLYRHEPSNPHSLGFNDVNRFAEDAKGNIWIGTNGGGLIYYDRTNGRFTTYRHQQGNENSLSNDVIVSLCIDSDQKLWIGTYFGGLDCYDGKNFSHYRHDPANPLSIADNRIWEIYEDDRRDLWIGTLDAGLDKMDRKTGVFSHYTYQGTNSIRSNYISAIAQERSGNLWIGTADGCSVLDKKTGGFLQYGFNASHAGGLSNANVICVFVDSKDRIWVGTRDGLNLFDRKSRNFQHFFVPDGIPDNVILNIVEDNNRSLWISTPKGLCNLTVTNLANGRSGITCKNYDEADGLQGIAFNENAAFKTSKGELAFGGPDGFNLFFPDDISSLTQVPKIVFTGFELFNKPINPGDKIDGRVLLPLSVNDVQSVTLNHNQNLIAIEFAALNFFDAEKIRYAYKLEGFKTEWLTADSRSRKATFTNLDPGEYILHVRTENNDGTPYNNESSLQIIVNPPFWKTSFAYLFYALLLSLTLYLARIRIIRKARNRFVNEQEKLEAHRMHALDMMKIRFFTNVSHEFRTPLSLIISPVEKLVSGAAHLNDKKQFQLILRNARRLLNLVNQLLDFRKLEEQELRLNMSSGDIIGFIREISQSFSDIAESKQINLSFITVEQMLLSRFDHDKLERILFNLLSNAFKFTPSGGEIRVSVELHDTAEKAVIQITISDTGIGISKEKQEKVFDRFFQNELPDNILNQGSGIGLAITKEFVRLHGGSIAVVSEVDKGSSFIVTLPVNQVYSTVEDIKPGISSQNRNAAAPSPLVLSDRDNSSGEKKKTLLLVEDNEDFRFYLKDNLKTYYRIVEASNGKSGWQKTLADHPDLIVCDISMPEMNGIELCQKIKHDPRTSFIPVIFLTALDGEQQQLMGLQTGASDYLTKPFNFEILHSKIGNLLSQQDGFRKIYQKQVQAVPQEIKGETADDKFVQQALSVIEKNMSNPDFSVEELSQAMFMSRGALYNKTFSFTGKSPVEFIRFIRIQRAAQLLQTNGLTVAEVAYRVGFNNPKNFSRYFKMEYNVLPSAYGGKNKKEAEAETEENS